jgi:hypothetical protein
VPDSSDLPIDMSPDPVIEYYEKDVDLTLIRENLKKTHEERLMTLQRTLEFIEEVRAAGETMRRGKQ